MRYVELCHCEQRTGPHEALHTRERLDALQEPPVRPVLAP